MSAAKPEPSSLPKPRRQAKVGLTSTKRGLPSLAMTLRRRVFVCALLVLTSTTWAGPRAGIVSAAWELDFEFTDPELITVNIPGAAQPRTYWYMLYRVTNRTGQDVDFSPSFRLVTETLDVQIGGENVHPAVYDLIAARHKARFPFFTLPFKMMGKLLQGAENARTSAIVFQPFDPHADSFRIYVSGLSGELVREPNAAFDPSQPESEKNPRWFLLQRTLEITYAIPGDAQTRGTPVRKDRQWVLR